MAVSQSLTLTETAVDYDRNSSMVRILWQSTQTGESHHDYEKVAFYYVSINGGAEVGYLAASTLPQNSTVTIVDKVIEIPHNSDGTGSITVRTEMNTSTLSGTVKLTKSLELTIIPRFASLDEISCSTAYFTGTFTLKYTPKSSTHHHICELFLLHGAQLTKVFGFQFNKKPEKQQTHEFSIPSEYIHDIYHMLPNDPKGTLYIILYTYTDTSQENCLGSSSKEITLAIPKTDGTMPTAELKFANVSSLASPFDTLYIKGKSKVMVDLEKRKGRFGSSIVSYEVSVGGKSGIPPYTSGYLLNSGNVTILGTLTDTRGFSRTYTETISVIDYAPPQILHASDESEVIAARCDSSGNLNDSGTFLKIKAKRDYINVSDKNTCSIRYRYKEEGGDYSDWTTILSATSESDEVDQTLLYVGEDEEGRPYGALDVESSYIVQIQAIDAIGETGTTTISVPTERVYLHKAGSINSLGIGMYVDDPDTIDISEKMAVRVRGALLSLEIPEGTDLDTLTKPNRYYGNEEYYAGYKNCPITEKVTFALEVISSGSLGQTLQRFTACTEEGTVYERQYFGGFWHAWECVNPPMHDGVEYRTKERYLGKPVYTKMVFLGDLPNARTKEVKHGVTDLTTIIRCLGHLSNGINIPHHNGDGVEIYADKDSVFITTASNQSALTGYAQIWYLKDNYYTGGSTNE